MKERMECCYGWMSYRRFLLVCIELSNVSARHQRKRDFEGGAVGSRGRGGGGQRVGTYIGKDGTFVDARRLIGKFDISKHTIYQN